MVGELPQVGGAFSCWGPGPSGERELSSTTSQPWMSHSSYFTLWPPWSPHQDGTRPWPWVRGLPCVASSEHFIRIAREKLKGTSRFGIRQNENWKDVVTDSTCWIPKGVMSLEYVQEIHVSWKGSEINKQSHCLMEVNNTGTQRFIISTLWYPCLPETSSFPRNIKSQLRSWGNNLKITASVRLLKQCLAEFHLYHKLHVWP